MRRNCHIYKLIKPFPKLQMVDSSKQKPLADDSCKFDKNGGKFSIKVENIVGKGEIAR